MSSPPQREINARIGRTGSRLATPAGGRGEATPGAASAPAAGEGLTLSGFFGVFRYSHRAIQLVWTTSSVLTVGLGLLTIVAGWYTGDRSAPRCHPDASRQ